MDLHRETLGTVTAIKRNTKTVTKRMATEEGPNPGGAVHAFAQLSHRVLKLLHPVGVATFITERKGHERRVVEKRLGLRTLRKEAYTVSVDTGL